MSKLDFLTPGAKLAFTKWRQAFVKALILHYFDPECYIRIETDASGYTISEVLSQLTLDNLNQWHLVAFFSQKMILAETKYKTHNGGLLPIVEAFKTWRHYHEGSQHEVLIFTNHNNLCWFIDIKSELKASPLGPIDYCQGKANKAVDALFWYPQQSAEEEKTLCAENVKILHRLQSLLARVSGFLACQLSQLSLLYQILICGTSVFPQLRQFWNSLQSNIAQNSPYITNIGGMRLQFSKL